MQPVNFSERDKYNDFPLLVQTIMERLNFEKWGFTIQIFPSGTLSAYSSAIHFQSKSCKIRIWTFRDRPYEEPEIYFRYGRLHAPDGNQMMTWNGEECYCWHDHLFLYIVLGYLDGLSPKEVAKKGFPHYPEVISKFNQEARGGLSQHERFVRYHNMIWSHYGQRLFDIFDIRLPNLWKQYVDFYREFRSQVTRFESSYNPNIC